VDVRDQVLMRAIITDAAYAGRLASDLSKPEHADFAWTISLRLAPYLSLFAYEVVSENQGY
jgi:hypothetical protein